MADNPPLQTENSANQSNINGHPFHTMNPSPTSKDIEEDTPQKTVTIYKDQNELDSKTPQIKKSTIFGSTFMITNICLGTTIFTFATRAKAFGLVWMLFFCFVVAIINYWSITRCIYASSRCHLNDYSEITEYFLGRKMRVLLNVILIVYSYASLMCFIALIFPLFGRFIQSGFYRNEYRDYDHFFDEKWGKSYIKFPFFIALAFLLSLICLIKDINKLNFSAYIGVAACGYALIVVMVQCHSYYQHYKYAGFKMQENGLKKMKIGTILGTILTTALHVISIVCGFLTDPINPEDLIIYRKNKGSGRDIFMVLARLFVSFSLIFTVPGYYFPLRLSVINSFTGGILTNKFNILFTFISIFACAMISAIYDKILNYLNYIGFISVFISFLFPVLMNVYSSGKKITYWKNILDIILAIIMCLIGLVACVATVIDDVKG